MISSLVFHLVLLVSSVLGDNLRTAELSDHEHHRSRLANIAPFAFPQLYQCIKADINPANEYHSQAEEDRWLYDKIFSKLSLKEQLGGTFIEIGALDGDTYSNTWFFEKKLDWRGVLIEGHPSNQPILRENAKTKRTNSAAFTNAICHLVNGHPNTLEFTVGTGPMGTVGSDVNAANKAFLDFWHKDKTTVPTDCIPMQHILDVTGMLDIDLFSLDVEGSEYAVLETIDFNATNFRVIVVELDGGDKDRDQKIRELLTKNGFENAVSTVGNIREECLSRRKDGYGCTFNEVFINPNYLSRKRSKTYYRYGTSSRC